MKINLARLCRPQPLRAVPPWAVPQHPGQAARFMQVHHRSLLAWVQTGLGPEPMTATQLAHADCWARGSIAPSKKWPVLAAGLVAFLVGRFVSPPPGLPGRFKRFVLIGGKAPWANLCCKPRPGSMKGNQACRHRNRSTNLWVCPTRNYGVSERAHFLVLSGAPGPSV